MTQTQRQNLVNNLQRVQEENIKFQREVKSYKSRKNRTEDERNDDAHHITFREVQMVLNQNTEEFILQILVSDKFPTYWEK